MAENKKTKIDLKARLGRTTQMGIAPPPAPSSSGAGPTPPPPASDPGAAPGSGPIPAAPSSRPIPAAPPSVRPPTPLGIAPPPGISQGIPLPPFGPRPQPQRAPDPKPSAAQQTIKVEIGEEIHEERKKWRTRVALGAVAGVAIGLGIGFPTGGASEKSDRVKVAARGAALLLKDVKAADEKLKDLDTKLGEAADNFKNKKYPEDLSQALAGLTIPFDDTNLEGKGVNGMTTNLFRMVNNYNAACKGINKARESLKNLIGLAKDPINKAWKEETTPVATFSVVFSSSGGKVIGDLVPTVSPFEWKKDFPEKYKISKQEGRAMAEKDVKRYQKGDLPGGDLTAIPLDPKSTAALTSDVMIGRLAKALGDLRLDLKGNPEDPTNPVPGALKMGEDLENELKKAAQNQ